MCSISRQKTSAGTRGRSSHQHVLSGDEPIADQLTASSNINDGLLIGEGVDNTLEKAAGKIATIHACRETSFTGNWSLVDVRPRRWWLFACSCALLRRLA